MARTLYSAYLVVLRIFKNQIMKISTLGIFLLAILFFPNISFAQIPGITAVDDTLCVNLGESFPYNVKANDVPPHLSAPVFLVPGNSTCIGLTTEGDLFFLPDADVSCCGLQVLKYRYGGCQPGVSDCEGVIFITIKCPKPDCFLVNLDDFGMNPNGSAGGANCAFACENSTATYYVPFNPASTYTWQVTGDMTTVAGANAAEIIVTWGPAGAGAITLTTTNPANVITICVEILAGPTASFEVSDSLVCCGNSVSFVNTSQDATGWFWDFGDGTTSNMFSPMHPFTTPGTYQVCLYVTKNNYDAMGNPLCCCTDSICIDIVVDSLKGPQINCISTLCAFDSSQYWTNATNCSSYFWTVLDANGVPVLFAGQGTDTISVNWGDGPQGTVSLAVLGCDSTFCDDPTSVIVPIIPATTVINGLTLVCQNATTTYTVPKWVSTYYDWQVTGGVIVSGQGTNTVTIQWGPGPGPGTIILNYSSTFLGGLPGQNPADCAGLGSLTVNIKPSFSITGPSVACLLSMSGFSATASPSATYTWTITPAAPFTGQGTNFINVTWSTGPGTYVVTATPTNPTDYCNSTVSTVIQVMELLPADTISGPVEICPGQTYAYFGQTTQTGVGFNWTVTGGTPLAYTGNPVTVTWNAVGPYGLSMQLFNTGPPFCSSLPISLPVVPKVLNGPLTITGSSSSCTNGAQNYAAAPAQHPDATYTWTITPATLGSVAAGQGTPNITVQWNNDPGSATLSLTVNLCNSSLTTTLPVSVNAALAPTITQTGILCPGVPAILNAGPGYANYAWSSGPSGPAFQTITITTGGIYTVTVTDGSGCTATDSYQAIALAGPVADISTGDFTTLCINPPNSLTVTINAQTNPNYSFMWYCNGILQVLPATQAFFTHTNTNAPGTFSYNVVVTDNNGCKDTSNVIIVTQVVCMGNGMGGCNADPYTLTITSMNQTPNCDSVAFTVSSSPNVTLTGWNFGDPNGNTNTGTLANAAHVYSKAGCFLATLSATVPGVPGGTCTVTETESVCVPLVANFNFSVACLQVNFTNLTTLLPGTGPITWLWNFGDGFTSTLENPMHTYAAGGTYTVMLTATNPAGCVSKITKTVVVAGPPTASISVDMNPCVGESVQFMGIGPGINSWFWNFGDGATNALQNPFHAYPAAGSYPVTLIVQDAQGCADTVMVTVTVHALPPADTIAFSPSLTICAGGTVTLTAPAGPYTWQWSASGGGATTQTITVTTGGTYSVTITDANGCTMVPDSVTVVVYPPPPAVISGNLVICDAGCTTLSASGGFNYTYVWLDNSLTPLVPAQILPTLTVCAANLQPGYAVMVTDANGCSAISAVVVVSLAVSPAFSVTVLPDSCAGTPAILTVVPVQPNVVYAWSNGGTGPTITVLQAGVYNVVGTDTITGCKGYGSQTIHPLPDLCIVPVGCYEICNPDTICGPDSLSAYQWNLHGVPIPGATGQCLIVMQSGTYTLTGATAFGCATTSDSLELMVIDCACEQLSVSAEPSLEDSCCWILSYDNQYGDLFGVVLHSDDTGFDFSNLDTSALQVFSIGANTISLVSNQSGQPLPLGALNDFLTVCLTDVLNSPQQIIFDWYDFAYEIVCSDTLELDCPVEPECLYLLADSIYCTGESVTYTITVCNPVDNDFEVGYIVLLPTSPLGIVVTPPNINVTPPMIPGECRDFTFVLSGPSLEGETFCFSLTAHDTVPGPIDTTHCCMLDTLYCVPIPDCMPCDDIGVENIAAAADPEDGYCCFNISLYNNYAANLFDGINLCLLPPSTTMTINNPFGSGWSTGSYTPTMIELDVVPPLGATLPLGVVTLPTICIKREQAPPQLLEIKWMQGDSVLCRDTVEFSCEPDCGYLLEEIVVCKENGVWNYSGLIQNTSAFTMGEAHIVFTSPTGMSGYNQTITFPGGLPTGSTYPFSFTLGAPATVGDTICFTVALHELNDDAQHLNCCTFHDCIVLTECPVDCFCDAAFQKYAQLGINCTILPTPPNTATFSPGAPLTSCDLVIWSWSDTPMTDTTYGQASITHTFPGPGSYKVCMLVYRNDPVNQMECKYEVCKEIVFLPVSVPDPGVLDLYPNPSKGSFHVRGSLPWSGTVQFRVANLYGQALQEWEVRDAAGQDQIPVALDRLDKGVYLLEISSAGKRWVKKVVIQ